MISGGDYKASILLLSRVGLVWVMLKQVLSHPSAVKLSP
jgi:hypothetical protein